MSQTANSQPVQDLQKVEFSIENIAKVLSFGMMGGVLLGYPQLTRFMDDPNFQQIQKGKASDFFYGFLYAGLLTLINQGIVKTLRPYMNQFLRTDKYTQTEARQRRLTTFAQFFYQTPFYFLASFAAYAILFDKLPPALGGSLDPFISLQKVPFSCGGGFWMRQLYLIQFGQNIRKVVKHCFFQADDAKYYEFVLHHCLTVLLIVVSYLTNFWQQGVLVMFIHDFSDGVIKIVRFYIDYKHKKDSVLVGLFLLGLATWIYLRIYVLLTCINLPFMHYLQIMPKQAPLFVPYCLLGVMLWGLEVLHIYWTYLFVRFLFMKEAKKMNVIS